MQRTNVFGGVCCRCGESVAPLAGYIEKVNGQWRVIHKQCDVLRAAGAKTESKKT